MYHIRPFIFMRTLFLLLFILLFFTYNSFSQDTYGIEIDPGGGAITIPVPTLYISHGLQQGVDTTLSRNFNVGIGIRDPKEKLHIDGSVRGNQNGALRISTGNGYIDLGPKSSSYANIETDRNYFSFNKSVYATGFSSSSTNPLQLQTNGTSRITILNSGNVGIGTTTPAEKLHINGSVRGNQNGALRISTGNGYIDLGPKSSSYASIETDRNYFSFNKSVYATGFSSSSTNPLQLQTNGTSRMTILNNGYVGLATTTPAEQFQIGDLWTFHNGGTKYMGYNIRYISNKDVRIADGYSSRIALSQDGDIRLETGGTGAANSTVSPKGMLILTSLGNVGIGTTNTHSYKLAVAGNILAEEVVVKLQGDWPDYVFNTDYSAPSIEQIEEHIQEKGHLPHVPSAEEINKSGINLGQMDALLLQKIEELTLLIIRQNKVIQELQDKVENR